MKIRTIHHENRTVRYLSNCNLYITYRQRVPDPLKLGKYAAEINTINFVEGMILEYGDGDTPYLAVKKCIYNLRKQKEFLNKYLR